jgi:hypothetical protein
MCKSRNLSRGLSHSSVGPLSRHGTKSLQISATIIFEASLFFVPVVLCTCPSFCRLQQIDKEVPVVHLRRHACLFPKLLSDQMSQLATIRVTQYSNLRTVEPNFLRIVVVHKINF